MATKMTYTARDIVEEMVGTFLECGAIWNQNLGTDDTLEFIKEKCERFNLDENIVKELFDDCQYPFYYDLETKEIVNGDESDDEDDKPLCKNCEVETRKHCDDCGGYGSDDESDDDEPVVELVVPKSAIEGCVGCGNEGKFPENQDGDTMCPNCESGDEEDQEMERNYQEGLLKKR